MDWIVWPTILIIAIALITSARDRAGRKKRIKEAFEFKRPPVHGVRKTASREQLKKAGLL